MGADAKFSGEIFRKDWPMVIAQSRQTALMNPVRLRYTGADYAPGLVLARNTVDGLFQAYNDAGASGINTARCVLFQGVAVEDFGGSTGTAAAVGIFGQCVLFEDKLTGLDSNGKTDLGATSFVDATGVNLLKF